MKAIFKFVVLPFALILFTLFFALPRVMDWRFINWRNQFVEEHGDECKAKAVEIKKGYAFSLCWAKEEDHGPVGGAFGSNLIVYDLSDEIALPSKDRSDMWNYMILSQLYAWENIIIKAEKIKDHFYAVDFFDPNYQNGETGDEGINAFLEKYACDRANLKFNCKKFKIQEGQ